MAGRRRFFGFLALLACHAFSSPLWGATTNPTLVAAWNGAVMGYFSSRSPDALTLNSLLPELARLDFSDPATMSALQPLQDGIQAAAQDLLTRRPGKASLAFTQKLETLATALRPFLSEKQRAQVQEAARLSRARLSPDQRARLEKRMQEITERLLAPREEKLLAVPADGRTQRRLPTLKAPTAQAMDVRIFSEDKELHGFTEGVRFPATQDEHLAFWSLLSHSPAGKAEALRRQALLGAVMGRLEDLQEKKSRSYAWLSGLKGILAVPDKQQKSAGALLFEANGYDLKKIQDMIRETRRKLKEQSMSPLSKQEETCLHLGAYIDSRSPIPAFVKAARAAKDPSLNAILDELEATLKAQTPPTPAELMRWIKENEAEKLRALSRQGAELREKMTSLGALLAFASLAREDGYARATFNDGKPAGYKQGWLFTLPKNGRQSWREEESIPPQVPTDSGRDTPFKVFTGSNMSGKSFRLKQDFFIQRLGQAFGWVPAKSANLRFFDRLAFIDRAETDSFQNLSAFGAEARRWLKGLENLSGPDGSKTMVYLSADEGFSTTSPEDQSLLLTATLRFGRKAGLRYALATHNEEFVERHRNDPDVSFYHFKVVLEPGHAPRYTRELQEGVDESHAAAVARAQGLPEDLLRKAQAYLDGATASAAGTPRQALKLVPYDETTRASLKRQRRDFRDFFPFGNYAVLLDASTSKRDGDFHDPALGRFPWKHAGARTFGRSEPTPQEFRKTKSPPPDGYEPLFPPLSQEPEFSAAAERGAILLAADADFSDDVVLPRLRQMVVATPVLTPQQVLERQRMFDLLAQGDPARLTNLAKDMRNLSSALQIFSTDLKSLDDFNLRLLGGVAQEAGSDRLRDSRAQREAAEIFLSFLDFNGLLTGTRIGGPEIQPDLDALRSLIALQKKIEHADELPKQGKENLERLIRRREELGLEYLRILGRNPTEEDYETWNGVKMMKFDTRKVGRNIGTKVTQVWKAMQSRIPAVSALDENKRALIRAHLEKMRPQVFEYFNKHPRFMFGDEVDWTILFEFLPRLLSDEDPGEALFSRLRGMDSVYLHQFSNYLETLWRTYLGEIRSGADYARAVRAARQNLQASDDREWELRGRLPELSSAEEAVFFTELSKLTDLFRFGRLIRETSRSRARFHEQQEIGVRAAWNPYAAKPAAAQVRNDADLSQESPVELLAGSNMSGKTFYQRAVVWALLEALSTGYAPGEVWTPVLTKIFFLDRVTGKLHHTLSAFGQEVELWKKWEALVRAGRGPMVSAMDEAWSTTSPRYQAALSHAVAAFGAEQGIFSLIASHNHDFLRRFAQSNGARISHFRTTLDENGEPVYDYAKQEGHQPSNGILAARRMGLTALIEAVSDLIKAE